MAGDRGMITSARIAALNHMEDGAQRPDADAYGWITALRAPAIRKLMADDGPLQLSLFDQQDLPEITSPDYPGERLIACRNPVLAADRARTCEDLLADRNAAGPCHHPRPGRQLTGAGPSLHTSCTPHDGIEVERCMCKWIVNQASQPIPLSFAASRNGIAPHDETGVTPSTLEALRQK
jgi:hypothetical protein